ncbi:MAG: T9SS type A sorting domain-containing protein [Bacteroidales bacterium]|nr:T9SS type A sorting domain-containing protein [Bacteroidales bacterium]
MKNITFILIALIFSPILQSQTWTQIGSDIDGEAEYDRSGISVSLNSDGSIVAIGASFNDGNGLNAGHVRIYENQNRTWIQIGQDIDGEAVNDMFGYSISLSSDGSIVAIGSTQNAGNGTNAGHVRIYENQSGTWSQIGQDIDGEAEYDRSGNSVCLSSDGSIVAIGAIQNDDNGINAGHVRIYENQNETWIQIGQDIDGEVADDYSGRSVSLSSDGSIVAIGATQNDGNGSKAGHVRIYENINETWTQIGQDIDGEALGDESGWSVSLNSDGSIVAIGAQRNDGNGSNAGHVRIYENQSGTWVQIGQDIDGEAADDYSGRSVCLSSDGSIVAIGALYNCSNGINAGHVRIYENQSGNWTQIGQDIDGEVAGDKSGSSVSLSSDGLTVAIGAPLNDGNSIEAGHARVFKNLSAEISKISKKGISIYPIPTSGIIYINLANKNIQELMILDITGKQIIEKFHVQQNNEIDLSDFESGIYIISIQTDNEIFTSKIMKR